MLDRGSVLAASRHRRASIALRMPWPAAGLRSSLKTRSSCQTDSSLADRQSELCALGGGSSHDSALLDRGQTTVDRRGPPATPQGGGTLPYFGSHRIRHAAATFLVNNGMPLDEVSRYLGHSSTDVTRRYARQTPEALGRRAAEAFGRAGVSN
jgi:hypothetical protein